MTKVLSQTGLTELIQLSKNEFLPKSGAVEATTVSLATVATSGSYNDLSNKPTIPTVNNATLTIQKNGTNVATFTANASSNVTANISVPTDTGDLTNNAGFITGISSSDVTTALGYTPYDSTNPSGYQANVIETVKVNGTALTPTNKAVDITVPSAVTEATVSGWGFTKNVGTVTSVNNSSPDSNGNVSLTIPTVDQTYSASSTNAQSGTAVAQALAGKADTDLSNLTSQGQNIANWSSNVTNCITEIPQDIKLELNNGTLTLKAGSKLYVPNGFESDGTTPHFDFVTTTSDITQNYGIGRSGCIVVVSNNTLQWSDISAFESGTTQPTSVWWVWYDTTTNKIKFYDGSTTVDGVSFPITIISENAGSGYGSGIKSIDQVFNGFGYIGSTNFMLPNVKCIETLGKNPDGSYITRVLTNTEVRTETIDSSISGNYWVGFNSEINANLAYFGTHLNENVISETQPSYNNVTWFNPLDGKWNYVNNGLLQLGGAWQYAIITVSNGKITNWKLINNTFKALNYWDKPTISGWSMPSSRYIDLTLGASGSYYTAPANGYISMVMDGTISGNMGYFAQLYDSDVEIRRFGEQSNSGAYHVFTLNFEIRKDQVFNLEYYGSTPNFFRFIYAEGEQ